MNLLWLVVIILLILAIFGVPTIGPWHHSYGYYPSGVVVVIAIILILFLVL